MSIKGVHHVQVTIPRNAEDEGRHFYCEVLGLKEIEKPEPLQGLGGFWLEVGDRNVHVGTEDGVDRLASKAHIAYQVEDINAWQQRLEQAGIKILDSIPLPGFDRFEFRDPFGNRIELIQPVSSR